jgi:alanine dehydrogenase
MRIGIPREIKDGEFRVALSPRGVSSLPDVIVERGAGLGVGFGDEEYVAAGAKLGDPWQCGLVVKVKELQPAEHRKPRSGQTVLSFDQFTVDRALLDAALASGATFISYNSVGRQRGVAPILAPMSAIAGRLAVLMGAWCPRAMLSAMRRGSALVDVGIDYGGIAETSRQTSHAKPIYVEEGVVHYCVPNMPAACPRTASLALERAVLPYVRKMISGEMDDDLRSGIAVMQGRFTAA